MIYFSAVICIVQLFTLAAGFSFFSRPNIQNICTRLHNSIGKADHPIQILTTAGQHLKDCVNDKIGNALEKLGKDVQTAHVTLKTNKHRDGEIHSIPAKKGSQKVEATVTLPGKVILHTTDHSDSMEGSIDKVAKNLARMITKQHKMHQENVHRNLLKRKANTDDLTGVLDHSTRSNSDAGLDDLTLMRPQDPIKQSIIRHKKFPMPHISVVDAIEALELMDHSFYVFRNIEGGDINVLYRRDSGGFGLIQPQ